MNYNYEDGKLTISLPTQEPAALHELLMKGLALTFRHSPIGCIDCHHALLDLLVALLPDEETLARRN